MGGRRAERQGRRAVRALAAHHRALTARYAALRASYSALRERSAADAAVREADAAEREADRLARAELREGVRGYASRVKAEGTPLYGALRSILDTVHEVAAREPGGIPADNAIELQVDVVRWVLDAYRGAP